MRVVDTLMDLDDKAGRGERFDRLDAERVLAEPDLVSIGLLGEAARRRASQAASARSRVGRQPSPGRPESCA
jgi:hypothetical protein